MNYHEIYPKGIFRDYINAFGSNMKEWTYAGFGITLISAFVAHASIGAVEVTVNIFIRAPGIFTSN